MTASTAQVTGADVTGCAAPASSPAAQPTAFWA
jgi:hypothetical protein